MNNNLMFDRFNTCSIGLEYAGIDTTGRRVMGLITQK